MTSKTKFGSHVTKMGVRARSATGGGGVHRRFSPDEPGYLRDHSGPSTRPIAPDSFLHCDRITQERLSPNTCTYYAIFASMVIMTQACLFSSVRINK